MKQQSVVQQQAPAAHQALAGALQRKCDCGSHTLAGAQCLECAQGGSPMQRKTDTSAGAAPRPAAFTVGARDDALEREAERVADQVLAAPARPAVNGVWPRIQRFARYADEPEQAVPASVEQVLAGSGRPLEPALRRDMGQRFGRDFSRVRVHSGAAAQESARELGAHAYTVGHHIVFGAHRFAPQTQSGRHLLAHELTHVLQQTGADGMTAARGDGGHTAQSGALLQRAPSGTTEDIHRPLAQEYQQAVGLPPDDSGAQAHSEGYARWLLRGSVAAPATAPALAAVAGPFNVASCGRVVPGMDPAAAGPIRACIYHATFVNIMNQSISNMRQVASPYAPGLADLYSAVLRQVISAGIANPPQPRRPLRVTVSNHAARVSATTTLPAASFTLELRQDEPGGANGAFTPFIGGIYLNETSGAAFQNDQADVERTMYHEGVHFFSALVTEANRTARSATGAGPAVRPELDAAFTAPYQPGFVAAAEPIWDSVLAGVTADPNSSLRNPTAQRLAHAQWTFRVENELLSRIEEAVYLALRAGRGFGISDLYALPQPWLYTVDYWDPVRHLQRAAMTSFLAAHRSEIDARILPFIRSVQRAYLIQRPAS